MDSENMLIPIIFDKLSSIFSSLGNRPTKLTDS